MACHNKLCDYWTQLVLSHTPILNYVTRKNVIIETKLYSNRWIFDELMFGSFNVLTLQIA